VVFTERPSRQIPIRCQFRCSVSSCECFSSFEFNDLGAARLSSRIFLRGKSPATRKREIDRSSRVLGGRSLNEGKKLSESSSRGYTRTAGACSRTMIDKRRREKGKATLRQKRESFGATVGITENATILSRLDPLRSIRFAWHLIGGREERARTRTRKTVCICNPAARTKALIMYFPKKCRRARDKIIN